MQDNDTSRELDVAWAAGLFEGEGCFGAWFRERPGNRKARWSVAALLGMTDRDVVERFSKVVGVGRFHGDGRIQREGWKPFYEWSAQTAADVIVVIDLLLPHLGERRTNKALEVRLVASGIKPHVSTRTHCPKGHLLAGENLEVEIRRRPKKDGTIVEQPHRRCRECRRETSRERARKRLGIKPENYRVKGDA